jgi:hypothetical protein
MTSVKTTEKFSVYWNYQVWDLAKGEQVDGGLADYLLETGSPVEELGAGPPADTDGDGVPDGTITQVQEWVGEDRDRAALALAAEQARGDKARGTLVAALDKLLTAS